MANASLTAGIFLMYSANGTSYTKLVDITDYPDLGTNVDQLDVTTLNDACHKYIEALPDPGGSLEFSGYFTPAQLSAARALEGSTHYFSVWFGGTKDGTVITPTGSLLKEDFQGTIRTTITGAGTDEAITVTYQITNETGFTETIGATGATGTTS